MPGPLEGYKVLELTSTVSGPFASMMLADQGADVVKVEHPITGTMRMPRPPFKFLNQDNFPKKQATILGADTREVLESLGVDNDHIIKIEDREVQNRILLASFNLDQVK